MHYMKTTRESLMSYLLDHSHRIFEYKYISNRYFIPMMMIFESSRSNNDRRSVTTRKQELFSLGLTLKL
jgi:hypothetical protein